MKWSLIRRKLERVDRAIDKAIAAADIPGAVVLARMPKGGELIEHCSVRGMAVVRPERHPMTRETLFDLASLTKPMATTQRFRCVCCDGGKSCYLLRGEAGLTIGFGGRRQDAMRVYDRTEFLVGLERDSENYCDGYNLQALLSPIDTRIHHCNKL